jgi:hypothetical protein
LPDKLQNRASAASKTVCPLSLRIRAVAFMCWINRPGLPPQSSTSRYAPEPMSTILRISATWPATAWPLLARDSLAFSMNGWKLRKLRYSSTRGRSRADQRFVSFRAGALDALERVWIGGNGQGIAHGFPLIFLGFGVATETVFEDEIQLLVCESVVLVAFIQIS